MVKYNIIEDLLFCGKSVTNFRKSIVYIGKNKDCKKYYQIEPG